MQKIFDFIQRNGGIKGILVPISIGSILSVELVVNVVSMSAMAPGDIERIGFVAMAVVIVALGIPAYLVGNKRLWALFCIIAVFLNTSFVLETMRLKAVQSRPESDYEVSRLDSEISKAQAVESALWTDYQSAVSSSNMERIKSAYDAKIIERQGFQAERKERIEHIASDPSVTGENVFVAIPRATGLIPEDVISRLSSMIQLVFFVMLFGSSQWAMITFVNTAKHTKAPAVKREPSPRKRPQIDYVAKWVESCWIGLENGKTDRIISQESFFEFWKSRGGFPVDKYKAIKQAAIDNEIIGPDDKIIIQDRKHAIDNLRNIMHNKGKE